jgi:hypothetical protein
MRRAHQLCRDGVRRYGGRYTAYLRAALRLAWAEIRAVLRPAAAPCVTTAAEIIEPTTATSPIPQIDRARSPVARLYARIKTASRGVVEMVRITLGRFWPRLTLSGSARSADTAHHETATNMGVQ